MSEVDEAIEQAAKIVGKSAYVTALVGAGIPMGSVMSSISERRTAFGRELRTED